MNNWDPRYDAILYRPHPVSPEHPSMPLRERAAQFASFKALSGFEDEIEEEGRYTDAAIELDESRRESLDARLHQLLEHRGEKAEFVWFIPDERKAGGSYCRRQGVVKKIDSFENVLHLQSGERIPLEHLYDIRGACFPDP